MIIVPAIIPKSFNDLEEKLGSLLGMASFVQVDICDGKFVESKSWPLVGDNGEFKKIVAEEQGLPGWENVDYEAHIMAETPSDEVADWVRAGASSIIVHVEAGGDTVESVVEEWGHTAEIGLAINLKTPIETLMSFFEKVKTIQLMGIDHVGYQGQVLDDNIYDRIRNLRQLAPNHVISVDGGVNLKNAKKLIDAGVDKLIVGSAIFGEGVPSENFKNFQALNDR